MGYKNIINNHTQYMGLWGYFPKFGEFYPQLCFLFLFFNKEHLDYAKQTNKQTNK